MNTQSPLSKKAQQLADMKAFSEELKANGFTVIISAKHPFEWMHFEKDGRFGTVAPDQFFGYNFGTEHKGSTKYGTGVSTDRQADLTIKNAIRAVHPIGFAAHSPANLNYQSVEDYMSAPANKWAENYIL